MDMGLSVASHLNFDMLPPTPGLSNFSLAFVPSTIYPPSSNRAPKCAMDKVQ